MGFREVHMRLRNLLVSDQCCFDSSFVRFVFSTCQYFGGYEERSFHCGLGVGEGMCGGATPRFVSIVRNPAASIRVMFAHFVDSLVCVGQPCVQACVQA